MTKYRKKPIVIDAEQFFQNKEPYPEGVKGAEGYACWIETLEGNHDVTDGDWIITGVKGEKYPVKDEIFEITYEKV